MLEIKGEDIQKDLYDFCSKRNKSTAGKIGISTRAKWIIKWLQRHNIDCRVDFWTDINYYHNIEVPVVTGFDKGIILLAHHDIVKTELDNINDNSASIINLLYLILELKKVDPQQNITIVFTDCEERGGKGSSRLADRINSGQFGKIDWALNLELTAVGGHWLVGEPNKDSALLRRVITAIPDCEIAWTPYNDAVTLRRADIDSVVVGILPKVQGTDRLDYSIFGYCHTANDKKGLENPQDMINFIEGLIKIIQLPDDEVIKKISTNQRKR